MNPLLLILVVFVISFVSSLRHSFTAQDEAEYLLKIVQKGLAVKNLTVFLSAFDESFHPKYCTGGEMGYKDLERIASAVGSVIDNIELKVEEAEFNDHGLEFRIVEQGPNGDWARVYAKYAGQGFYKIYGFDYSGKRCPSHGTRTLLDDNFY